MANSKPKAPQVNRSRKKEEKFRLTFDQSPIGTALLDVKDGRFARINAAFCRFTGYSKEELTQFTFKDLTYPDDLPLSIEQTTRLLVREIEGFEMEKRYVRKDGSIAWGHLSVQLVTDRSGQIVYTLAMIQDITKRKNAELQLRENEEAVKSLLNATNDVAFLMYTNGCIIAVNTVLARRLGKKPEKLTGHNIFDLFPEEIASTRQSQARKVIESGKPVIFEDVSMDGRYFSSCIYPLFDTEGKIVRLAVHARDITDAKVASAALAESEVRFKQLFDSINDGISVRDAVTSELIDANRRFCDMYGYTLEELKSLPLGSLAGGESPEERQRRLGAHYALAAAGLSRLFQAQARRKDGSTFWVEVNVKKIIMGGRESLLAVSRDITERRKAEEALRESEEKFRYLFDSVRDGIAVRDALTLELVDANRRLSEMWGYSVDELKSLALGSLGAGETVDERRARLVAYYKQLGKGVPALYEWPARKKDGSIFWVELNGARITIGSRECLLLVVRDVTERRSAEEALRRSEEAALRLAKETAVIAEVGRIMTSSLEVDEVYERFAEEVRKLIPFDRILINLMNKQEGTITTTYAAGMEVEVRRKGAVFPLQGSITDQMIRTGMPMIINADSLDEVMVRFPLLTVSFKSGLRSRLSVPLLTRGEVIGSLALWSKQPHAYGDREIRLAESVASQIAGTVANAQLFRERKRAEEALRTSEARYRDLFDNMLHGFSYCEMLYEDGRPVDFVYRAVNNAFEELTGLKDVVGRKVSQVIPGIERMHPELIEIYGRVASTAIPERFETEVKPLDTWFSVSVYSGGKDHFVAIFDNITERKRAEAKIRASLKEKEVLLKEIHHRVKNNLQIVSSLLYLQSTRTEHAGAVSALRESRARIKSMALIHERLYASPDLASVDMAKYTRNLVSDLHQSHMAEDGVISISFDLEDIPLGINEAIPCGLIINELVSNALKHAFPKSREGEITVRLQRAQQDKKIILVVSDNGIGFPEHVDFRKSPSLGLTLINSLVEQLNGSISLDTIDGTTFTITFGR